MKHEPNEESPRPLGELLNDEEFLLKLRDGDQKAWTEFYYSFRPWIWSKAKSHVRGDGDWADNIVHDVMLILWLTRVGWISYLLEERKKDPSVAIGKTLGRFKEIIFWATRKYRRDHQRKPLSLDAPVGTGDEGFGLADLLVSESLDGLRPSDLAGRNELSAMFDRHMAKLRESEQAVIREARERPPGRARRELIDALVKLFQFEALERLLKRGELTEDHAKVFELRQMNRHDFPAIAERFRGKLAETEIRAIFFRAQFAVDGEIPTIIGDHLDGPSL